MCSREELGFEGVITTDDIGMGAVSTLFDGPGITARALQAGCDLIMVSAHWTDTDRAVGLADGLLESLRNGELSSKVFESAQTASAALLRRDSGPSVKTLPDAVFATHSAIRDTG